MKKTLITIVTIGLLAAITNASANNHDYEQRQIKIRKAKWEPICKDFKNSWQYIECWKEPGATKRVYELSGRTRQQMIERAKKSIEVKKLHHQFINR